jgi:DNA-binding SARP family transcriptional activator/tetratricopeptide (TPR) repeat protein
MWLGVLGSLLVTGEGAAIAVPSDKQRILLAALLLRPNRPVSFDALAEALWDADPPPSAPVTIRNHVKRLRKTLGPVAGPRIVTRQPGYLMEVGADECDLTAFAGCYRRGLDAARAGDWRQAADTLGEALSYWRGELLADVPSPSLLQNEGPRITEMRLQALETRNEALLQLGGSADLVADLRQLVAEHPLRERFQGQLMLALYRSGRQADSLAVYQAAHRKLVDELGVGPGPDLRALHEQILRADPRLVSERAQSERVQEAEHVPGEIPGVAPPQDAADDAESVSQSNETALPIPDSVREEAPRHSPALLVPRQLPAGPRHFAGRGHELKMLEELADQAAAADDASGTVVIAAIDGTAGIGKTALALHWAHRIADRFPDGQLYANLRGFDPADRPVSPAEAIRGFLDAFGVPVSRLPADLDAQSSLYRSLLSGQRVLVVLDNARDVEQVRPLLPGSSSCLVVVTSRSPLTGLAVAEGAGVLTLDVLSADEARDLLDDRLPADRLNAELSAVDELVELCAGLPLALGIAAARAAARPALRLSALAEQLCDTRRRLDALAVGDDSADLRAVFSWSYRSLSAAAARMFRLLGLDAGPDVSLSAAACLAGVPPNQARRLLSELARASLLNEHIPDRYGFHDLLRAYAAEQAQTLDPEAERRAALRRELDFYLYTAHAAARLLNSSRKPLSLPPLSDGVAPEPLADYDEALAWLQAEHQVLLAAISTAAATGFDLHACQIAWTLSTYQNRLGYWHDWTSAQHIALAAALRLGDKVAQAEAHRNLGRATLRYDDNAGAQSHLERTLALHEELGDPVGQADALIELARVLSRQDRYSEALDCARRALRLYQETGDAAGPAYALNAIGWYHCQSGDYATALEYCEQALELHGKLNDGSALADTWDSLGYVHFHLGDTAAAVSAYEHAADLYRQVDARYDMAATLTRIGDAHRQAADRTAAVLSWQRALTVLDEIGHPDADEVRDKLARSRREMR